MATACFVGEAQKLKTGDLLFVSSGDSSFSQAIADATASNDSLRFVHVALFYIDDQGKKKIIEADPEEGVRIADFSDFIEENGRSEGKGGIIVKRLNFSFPVDSAVQRAKNHIGEPYDWSYLPDNGKMYCSELIEDIFRDENGEKIFRSAPMNFLNPDGTLPEFWKNLFEKLGEQVPQGVDGTNPTDLSKDTRLVEIYRFF